MLNMETGRVRFRSAGRRASTSTIAQLLTETITYVGNSTQVASITTVSDGYTVTYSYTYDNNGNISTVSDGTYCTQYFYDAANQLIRENNQQGNFICVWTYDDAGNILTRTVYPYTTGEPGQAQDSVAYTYGDSEWGDLLNVYDGISITYDEIGNPVTENGYTVYTWKNGRQLATAEGAMGYVWTYTYDVNGMRIGKQRDLGGPSYSYVYNGGQLMQMRVGTDTYSFTYDASGTPMTISHNGTVYYYVTNLQGDVVAIVDSTGVQVVGYTYDAWGKVLSQTGTMAWSLGEENPLRYRGYVYDQETDLYYLQSRYYDPELGRFINADAFTSTGQGILGNNMFTYCNNNPVNCIDYNGKWTVSWGIGANLNCLFGVSFSIQMVLDGEGNIAGQITYAVPWVNDTMSIGAIDIGGGQIFQYTNGDTYKDLENYSTTMGVSAGETVSVGADAIVLGTMSDIEQEIQGNSTSDIDGVQVTVGAGLGLDAHVVQSSTKTLLHVNIIEKGKQIWDAILGIF